MSSHVAPHRWADAMAGKLAEGEVSDMEKHAADCPACTKARNRVQRASQSFPALRAQSSPELGWDGVRARVHWTVSSERRARRRASGRRLFAVIAFGAAGAAAATAAFFVMTDDHMPSTPRVPVASASVQAEAVAGSGAPAVPSGTAMATPLGALVVREVGGHATIDGAVPPALFDRVLAEGAAIATGDGSLDVQFDRDSAIALGPKSKLTLAHFDSQRVELRLDEGTVDVVVSKRAPEQRFIVVAGSRAVEVRGTQFRVVHGAASTAISCAHGRVVVRDGSGEVEVGAERGLEVPMAASISTMQASELSAQVKDLMASATPHTMPIWTSPAQLLATSSPLDVSMAGHRDVRVDGLEVGQGPLRVRVMPGRHLVDSADSAGRFRRAGWVDVTAGTAAHLEVQPETAVSTGGEATRRKQLLAGIARDKLSTCVRAITKSGVTDTFVRIEISVDETGAVQFLNIVDTDLPSTTARCVRDVLADVRFAPGPAATFHEKIDL